VRTPTRSGRPAAISWQRNDCNRWDALVGFGKRGDYEVGERRARAVHGPARMADIDPGQRQARGVGSRSVQVTSFDRIQVPDSQCRAEGRTSATIRSGHAAVARRRADLEGCRPPIRSGRGGTDRGRRRTAAAVGVTHTLPDARIGRPVSHIRFRRRRVMNELVPHRAFRQGGESR